MKYASFLPTKLEPLVIQSQFLIMQSDPTAKSCVLRVEINYWHVKYLLPCHHSRASQIREIGDTKKCRNHVRTQFRWCPW